MPKLYLLLFYTQNRILYLKLMNSQMTAAENHNSDDEVNFMVDEHSNNSDQNNPIIAASDDEDGNSIVIVPLTLFQSKGSKSRCHTLYPQYVLVNDTVKEFHEQIHKKEDGVQDSAQLFTIILNGNVRGSRYCLELFASDKWLNLQVLDLSHIHSPDKIIINQNNMKILVDMDLPQLKKLLITFNYVDEGCCKVMMGSKWPELTHLDLGSSLFKEGHNQIRDKGCYYLSKAEWPRLEQLILRDNYLTSSGLKFLRKGNFPILSSIDLNQNQIKQTGCVHISKFPQKLRTSFVNLGSCKLNNQEKAILSKGQIERY